MLKKTSIALLLLLAGLPTAASAEQAFSFYGLRFGMSRAEVGKAVSLMAEDVVRNPGHGMSSLALFFDRNDLLMEIRAGYAKPDEPMQAEGVRRALNQRLLLPIRTSHPGLEATIDEYGNRAGLTVLIRDKGLREENVQFFQNQFLSKME